MLVPEILKVIIHVAFAFASAFLIRKLLRAIFDRQGYPFPFFTKNGQYKAILKYLNKCDKAWHPFAKTPVMPQVAMLVKRIQSQMANQMYVEINNDQGRRVYGLEELVRRTGDIFLSSLEYATVKYDDPNIQAVEELITIYLRDRYPDVITPDGTKKTTFRIDVVPMSLVDKHHHNFLKENPVEWSLILQGFKNEDKNEPIYFYCDLYIPTPVARRFSWFNS